MTLPFSMLTECMVCFVLIISKNDMSKLKVLGRNLDLELVKQKYISKVVVHYFFFVKTASCCLNLFQ